MALKERDFLLQKSPGNRRPFICRHSTHRIVDKTNGVIGQAWIMEGLIYAAKFLDCDESLREAERLYSIHSFDSDLKAWRACSPDGSVGRSDKTFNHQLWFCSVAVRLPAVSSRAQHINSFMHYNAASPRTFAGGIIAHNSQVGLREQQKKPLRKLWETSKQAIKTVRLCTKSVAYHPFNLYAYCGMYTAGWNPKFFEREEFQRLVRVCSMRWCDHFFYGSKFGAKYNPVGFELLYIKRCFPQLVGDAYAELLGRQMSAAPLLSLQLSKKTDDNATLNSRIYELAKIALDFE